MESLKDIIEGEVQLKEYLLRIGDLINIDGPLLSLFSDVRNEDLYLYDWVDDDNSANRFLIYRVAPDGVLNYINKKLTHRELFSRAIGKRYCIADIRVAELSAYKIFQLTRLPTEYNDVETNLFDAQFSKDVEKILLFVTRRQARTANDFKKEYASTYCMVWGSAPSEVIDQLKNEHQELIHWETFPIQGSISSKTKADQIIWSAHAAEIYLIDENLGTQYVREDNHLPERKGMELYR